MESEKVKFSAFLVQGLATCVIASSAILTGISFAWPSYTLANLTSNATILSHPMSSIEVSMLGSLPNVGGIIATPLTEYVVNVFGRKYSAMLFGLPFVLTWTIISTTTSVPLVIAAVTLAGFGAAGQAISTVFIAEIAQDSIRGGLSSTIVAGYFIGLLISYSLGGQLSYYMVIYTIMSICVLYILMLMLLKESPVFLVQKGKMEEAAKSIAFYRRVDKTSKEVEIELKKIKLQIKSQLEINTEETYDPEATRDLLNKNPVVEQRSVSSWKFLMTSESSKKALGASLFLMVSNTFMGAIVFQVYAEPIFQEAVPSMPSNLCSIFLAITFLLSVISCAIIIDRYGRKFLMTSTSIGSGIATAMLAVQLMTKVAPNWFTVVLIYSFCYVNYLGAATVPFVFMAEVFLPEVRGLGNSITMASYFLCNFVELMVFGPLVEACGLGVLFCIFSTVCFLTAFYSHFYLPETRGLSSYEIQKLFLKNKSGN